MGGATQDGNAVKGEGSSDGPAGTTVSHDRSANTNASINAALARSGLAAGQGPGPAGRVTKARYEPLRGEEGRDGEWGVLHLYRDGEEEASAVEASAVAVGEDGGAGKEGKVLREEFDCSTLCIPAVPSYIMPSDFLGFVGEKTREEVSHFRMVMTGRMNRYLVLMKFTDGGAAMRWRSEWDGKLFNKMEVSTTSTVQGQTPCARCSSTITFLQKLISCSQKSAT